MRKPKSKLETELDDAQQAALADWLLSGMPYHQARELVQKDFGLRVALSAFTPFWQTVCAPALVARRHRAVSTANDVAAAAAADPGRFDDATIDALKQKAFELSISPHALPGQVKALFSLVLKSRDQDLKSDQVNLARQKFQRDTAALFLTWSADQRAQAISASPSSNADKIEQLGKLMFADLWK